MIKRTIRFLILAGIGYLSCFLALFFSAELSEGIRNGISLCINLVIPSTFLFLILSQLLLNTSFSFAMARPFSFLAGLFRIPKPAVRIFLLSLIGGYPVGATLLAQEAKCKTICEKTASRMLCFCTNCSPSFLITGIGTIIFGNTSIGVLIWICETISCVCLAFVSRFFIKSEFGFSPGKRTILPFSCVLIQSVHRSVTAMASICAFVLLFSAISPVLLSFLEQVGFSQSFCAAICGMIEVSNGCRLIGEHLFRDPLAAATLFSSFGGICVLVQIAAVLKGTNISIRPLLWSRLFHCGMSMCLSKLLAPLFFHGSEEVFSRSLTEAASTASSPAAFVVLIFLAIMLLFFTEKPATMKLSKKKTRKSLS